MEACYSGKGFSGIDMIMKQSKIGIWAKPCYRHTLCPQCVKESKFFVKNIEYVNIRNVCLPKEKEPTITLNPSKTWLSIFEHLYFNSITLGLKLHIQLWPLIIVIIMYVTLIIWINLWASSGAHIIISKISTMPLPIIILLLD